MKQDVHEILRESLFPISPKRLETLKDMKQLEHLLAEKLLKVSAIKLQPDNPFTWASGW